MLLGSGYLCEPRWKWFQSIGTHYMDIPVHSTDPISPPYDIILDERVTAHYLEALRCSVKEQIAFLEEQTGKKLDMNYFRKIMANSQKAISLWHSVLKLRTNVPCPMGAPDYFSSIIPQMYMLGEEEAVDFYERLYEEVQERVDKGIGVIPNEKYRLMWFGIPPWHNLGFFNYLESMGAVVCAEMIYYVGPPIEVDLSDPVEGLIQREWKQAVWRHEHSSETMPELFSPAIFVPSKAVLSWAKDYKIDGAIMHRTRSCRATSVGQVHYKNLLEKEGVPSLIFETDMSDPRNWSDAQIKTRVSAFIELLDSRSNEI
jgi:benzoyl-CoA reductase/2-hydroxyglutaryl-CoA dehydratase subunit BcrC/BadD/HgdB